MKSIKEIIRTLFALSLKFYPQEFKALFGAEMQVVFYQSIRERSAISALVFFLSELRDLPRSLINAYSSDARPGGIIHMNQKTISRSTRWQALIGILPFIAFGLSMIIEELGDTYGFQGYYSPFVLYLLVLVGLLIGWVRGFPLWSYSYIGWAVTLAWMNSFITIDGVMYGPLGWLLLGIVAVIALIWTRSLESIKKFFEDIVKDWTRISLAIFAFVALTNLIYDENHHPYLLLFIAASTLILSGAVWLFLRSEKLSGRFFSLFFGFGLAMIVGQISYATWDYAAYYGLPESTTTWVREIRNIISFSFFWVLILFWPAAIGLIKWISRRSTS